jgi:hypothetical protein
MIADTDLAVAKAWGMLPAATEGSSDGRTAADNQTVRSVFVIGPDRKIKLTIAYPMSTGRNFYEVLRVLDSLQLTASHKVATPVNWEPGEDVVILPSIPDADARKTWPDGWRAPRPYMRFVPDPGQPHNTVRYHKAAIATFDLPLDGVFGYMSAGGHLHAAFKSHRLVSVSGDVVTIAAEIYNPDGSTFSTTITHTLRRPHGVETRMAGGAFDAARFAHTYTALDGGRTRVDLEGEFPVLPGMKEADELAMIDQFFTMVFAEDMATLRSAEGVKA